MIRTLSAIATVGAVLGLAGPVLAQEVPPGYDPSYAQTIAGAKKEGVLRVYGTTDAAEVKDLLDDFRSLYPGLQVEYADQNSTELYNRFISEAAAGTGSGDLLWSSAMDLQIKLVSDGYALTYKSPEASHLPSWAVFKDEAYGVTAEPIGIAYNKRLVKEADVPKTHADFAKMLSERPDEFKGKVASYDPERSGVGFLFITQDVQVSKDTWDLVKAMGKTGLKLYTSTGAMLERVASGEHLFAYNMIGSYAIERSKKDPSMGIVLPSDYTLVMSRIAFVPKAAAHPNAGKLFLDYLLSQRGQKMLVARSLGTVREDVESSSIPASAKDSLKPIQVGPDLLTYLDQAKRLKFLKQWQQALKGK